jgi:hypothetical protein
MDDQTALKQSVTNADWWMGQAVEKIDQQFGEGYAKAHPELIVGFIGVAERDYTAMITQDWQEEEGFALRAGIRGLEKAVYWLGLGDPDVQPSKGALEIVANSLCDIAVNLERIGRMGRVA